MLETYYAEDAKGKALSGASTGCKVANPAGITKNRVQPYAIYSTPNAFIAGDAMGPHQTHSNMRVSALFVL